MNLELYNFKRKNFIHRLVFESICASIQVDIMFAHSNGEAIISSFVMLLILRLLTNELIIRSHKRHLSALLYAFLIRELFALVCSLECSICEESNPGSEYGLVQECKRVSS